MAKKQYENFVSQMGRLRRIRNEMRDADKPREYATPPAKGDESPGDFQKHKLANLKDSGAKNVPAVKK